VNKSPWLSRPSNLPPLQIPKLPPESDNFYTERIQVCLTVRANLLTILLLTLNHINLNLTRIPLKSQTINSRVSELDRYYTLHVWNPGLPPDSSVFVRIIWQRCHPTNLDLTFSICC